jgi:hypothetical protein
VLKRRSGPRVLRHPWLLRSLILGATAFYVPLTLLADHPGYITRDYRLIAVGFALFGLNLAIAFVLDRWLRTETSTNLVFVVSMAIAVGGRTAGPTLAWTMTAIAVFSVMVVLVVRLRHSPMLNTWFAFFAGGLWLLAIFRLLAAIIQSADSDSIVAWEEVGLHPLGGDVVVVIFDEYPSETFAQGLGVEMWRLRDELAGRQFDVLGDIRANYAWSEFALPSFFMMALPKGAGDLVTEQARSEFLGALGGANPFVEAFQNVGFEVTLVESGWSGLRCMTVIDNCVVRSWYDEVTWSVARRSILNGVVASLAGDPFTLGVERNIAWMKTTLPSLSANGKLDLVIVHLLLPHTPVAFDSACDRIDGIGQMRDQIQCANMLMVEVAEAASEAAIVVFFGDHGTKTMNQGSVPAGEWSQEMIDERMVTFAATRGLDGCSEPPAGSITNLSIRIVRCLGSSTPAYVEDTSFGSSLDGESLVEMKPSISSHSPP